LELEGVEGAFIAFAFAFEGEGEGEGDPKSKCETLMEERGDVQINFKTNIEHNLAQ